MRSRRFLAQTGLLGFSLISMQGVIYVLQLLAAQGLGASDFNFVRVTESLSAVLSLLISFGLPSVALVWAGRIHSRPGRARLLRLGSMFMLGATLLVYVVLIMGAPLLQHSIDLTGVSWAEPHFLGLAVLVSFRLFLVALLQSNQRYSTLACGTTLAGSASLLAAGLVFFTWGNGVAAWLVARYTLEATACVVFAAVELKSILGAIESDDKMFDAGELAGAAFPVGGGMVLRAFVEHGPLLTLSAVGISALALAEVGLVVTIVTVSIILVGVVQGVLIPRLVQSFSGAALRLASAIATASVVGSVVVMASLCLIMANTSTYTLLGDWSVVLLVAGIIVAKSIGSLAGGLLLVLGRMRSILLLNALVFLTLLSVFRLADADLGTVGALRMILLVEMCGAVLYASVTLGSARRTIRGKA